MACVAGRNPQESATPRRLTALVVLAVAVSACAAQDSTAPVDGAGGPERSVVCHYDAAAGAWSPLTLTAPAVQAHLRHGDAQPGDRLPDDSGVFGTSCEGIADPPPGLPNIVEIHPPSAAAGQYGAAGAAFGAELIIAGLTGSVALVNDATMNPSDACSPLVGFPAGSIALADRSGNCTFVQMATHAQNAGAVGLIVVNNTEGLPVIMEGTAPGIAIPSVMVSMDDGAAIKAGLPATGTLRRLP